MTRSTQMSEADERSRGKCSCTSDVRWPMLPVREAVKRIDLYVNTTGSSVA